MTHGRLRAVPVLHVPLGTDSHRLEPPTGKPGAEAERAVVSTRARGSASRLPALVPPPAGCVAVGQLTSLASCFLFRILFN